MKMKFSDKIFFAKVVQEYERAVIMRLGRILPGMNQRRIE